MANYIYCSDCVDNKDENTCLHDSTAVCAWCRTQSLCENWNPCTKRTTPKHNCSEPWRTNTLSCTGNNIIPIIVIVLIILCSIIASAAFITCYVNPIRWICMSIDVCVIGLSCSCIRRTASSFGTSYDEL